MKKFVAGITATALFVSMAGEAEAAIKKVGASVELKSGKLVSKKTGKVVKGHVRYKAKVYYNGKLFTGVKDRTYYKKGSTASGTYKAKVYRKGAPYTGMIRDVYYKKGVASSGTYKGKVYANGALYSGLKDEVLYADGEKVSGLVGGVYYEEGAPYSGEQDGLYLEEGKVFSGVVDQSLYVDGKKPAGYKLYEGILYCDGDIETATVQVNDVWYAGGKLANGSITTEAGEQFYVVNGFEVSDSEPETPDDTTAPDSETDDEVSEAEAPEVEAPEQPQLRGYELISGKLYYNGVIATGTQLYNENLYSNGVLSVGIASYHDRYYENGMLANGLITVGNQQLLVSQGRLASGVKDYVEYVNGEAVSDFYYTNGTLYFKGQPNVGVVLFRDKWFNGASLANGLTDIHGVERMLAHGVNVTGLVGDIYYKDGVRFTGVAQKILYTNGVRETGRKWHGGLFFVDGLQVEGIFLDNGIYYVNGALATGRYDVPGLGVRYLVKGVLANGLVQGIYYKDGERMRGLMLIGGKLYYDGVPNTGVKRFEDNWYYNEYPATGIIFTAAGEEYAVENGKGVTGFYQLAYYVNGKLEEGYVLRSGELYFNGRPHNHIVEYEGIWYARTKPAHGVYTINNVTYCFDNGVKFTGFYHERYFKDGVLAQGPYNGKNYVDGIEQP